MADKTAKVNPFSFGDLALDDSFTNREAELRELTADVLNGQNVVIFAPRRYGKTSLVWRATQQLISKRVLVAQVDLMTVATKEQLAAKLAQAIVADPRPLPPTAGGRAFVCRVPPQAHQHLLANALQVLDPLPLGQGPQDAPWQVLVPAAHPA